MLAMSSSITLLPMVVCKSRKLAGFSNIILCEYSHPLEIVHRDLKVLLDNDLNLRIAHFGLSNEISGWGFLNDELRKSKVCSPEVIRGGVYAGPEIGVWSYFQVLFCFVEALRRLGED
jgi:serine/threonine protein kinase